MKRKFFILLAMVALMMSCVVQAEDINAESSLTEETEAQVSDNSDLPVNVIGQRGDTRTVIYSGPLGGYDNGAWCCMDFSKFQFALILTWDESDTYDVIYVVPLENEKLSNGTDLSIETEANKAVYQKSVVQTAVDDNLNIDISLLYDNAYSECVLSSGEELTAEVKVENTDETTSADINVMIALYDENARLIGVNMESQPVAANYEAVISPTITVPSDNTAANAKVMVWSRTGMKPYTNALMLTVAGLDYFGDDYNLAVNMNDRNSAVGMINSEDDTDIFEFEVLKDGLYIFESYGTTDTYAVLSNKTNPDTAIKTDDNSGIDNNFRLSATLEAGNTYYLKVNGRSEGKYKIVSSYAIGNVFGTVSPVKLTGDAEFDKQAESKCSLYTLDSNDFVAQMHLHEYTYANNEYADFSLIGVSAGEYLVKVSRPGYLSRYSKIALNDNAVDLGNKVLTAGDVNDDGVVDSKDLELLRAALNSQYGDEKYIINADFNGDKVVNSADENILISNMGQTSNDYGENVEYINFDVSVSGYNANISGSAKANSNILCSVYRGDIFVSDQEIACDADGSFNATVELSQNGIYTIIITSDNRAFDAVKTIECN